MEGIAGEDAVMPDEAGRDALPIPDDAGLEPGVPRDLGVARDHAALDAVCVSRLGLQASTDIVTATYAGCAFLGGDTPIGPMYLGYGLAESGNSAAYFFLGQSFGPRD